MIEYIAKEDVWMVKGNPDIVTDVGICREFAEIIKEMMKMPEYGFCDIERIMEIALAEMEQGEWLGIKQKKN